MKRAEWIKANWPAAVKATAGSGIFPEVMLSQAIIESSGKNGEMPGSQLARKYNNYFGILASKGWTGEVVDFGTKADGVPVKFRVYNSPADSFKDYIKFLSTKRYSKVRAAKNPYEQANLIEASGYAGKEGQAAKYGELLQKIITQVGKVKGLVIKAGGLAKDNAGILLTAAAAALLFSYGRKKRLQ